MSVTTVAWCPKPVRWRGSLVLCNLAEGHDGRCQPTSFDPSKTPYNGGPVTPAT
jgi:hypothetical protein